MHKPEPTCLVLGPDVTALGVIRSLGRAGIPLMSATEPSDISQFSRWHSSHRSLQQETLTPDSLATRLPQLATGETVLMPCSDEWVQAVSRLDLSELPQVHSWTAEPSKIDILVDKNLFRERLELIGVPHPGTYAIDDIDDLRHVPEQSFEHAFLKPHDSNRFQTKCGKKGIVVKGCADAEQKLRLIHDKGLKVVLQEYVQGPATNHFFVDGYRPRGSDEMRLLARRRLRMYPPDFGNSTEMVTVKLDTVRPAIASLRALFESLNYHGIFSAEFKFDDRDSDFKLLEVNCRPWWYIDYADRCGLHVCTYAYQDALDQRLDTYKTYRIGKRCVYPVYDWAARYDKTNGGVEKQSLLSMIKTWLFAYQPIFSWTDPMPAIMNFFRLVRAAYRRRIR